MINKKAALTREKIKIICLKFLKKAIQKAFLNSY